MKDLQVRIDNIKEKIARAATQSGRLPSDILLVAVSKTVDIDVVEAAYKLGIGNFGENRVQELRMKVHHLPGARWHMIGRLQTNKVKDVVGQVCLIHSLDRWNLAKEINKRGRLLQTKVPVLLQVNIAGEEQKAGVNPDDIEHFLASAGELEQISIQGFMTMAPLVDEPEETRPVFKELYQIWTRLRRRSFPNTDLRYLSMGMSQDYEIAIQEGANIVRIGSAIFHGEN